MKARLLLSLLALSLFATALRAADDKAADDKKKEAPPHDYSRATLIYIFSQEDEDDNRPEEPGMKFEYQTKNWNFRWMPFLIPIVVNRDFGTASIAPVVNPFALLGMDYAETAETYPDRGPQTRYRRKMLGVVAAANKADKARRLGQ